MANRFTNYELLKPIARGKSYYPKGGAIYSIVNTINNKEYIGSCVNFHQRANDHKKHLVKNVHANGKLQNSFNKYGIENFNIRILESIEDTSNLLEREQYYMDTQEPFFNIRKVAHSNLGLKYNLTDEQRLAASERVKNRVVTQETRDKISRLHTGSKRSEETCNNISKALIGKKLSEEHILSLERGKTKIGYIIVQMDKDMNELNRFETVGRAYRHTNIPKHSINECLSGRNKTAYSFKWEYRKVD